jgi:hypothetical protein
VPDAAEPAIGFFPTSRKGSALAPEFQSAAKIGIGIQIVLVVPAAMLLDGGAILRVAGIAAVGHLVGIVIVAFRRPLSPTAWDLAFVKFGTPLLMVVASVLAMALGRWAGLTDPPVVVFESVIVMLGVVGMAGVSRVVVLYRKRQRLKE